MRYRSLGNSGLVVSVAGLGGNNFGRRLDIGATRAVVDAAMDAGITRLDTADSYGGGQPAGAGAAGGGVATAGLVSAKTHGSLLERGAEAEVVPAARHFGLGVLPYFPLANGLLTGKVRRGVPPPEGSRLAGRPDYITDDKLDRVEALIVWAQQHGVTVLDVAIGGPAAPPGCSSVHCPAPS